MIKKSHQYIRLSRALGRDALDYVLEAVESGTSYSMLASELFAKTQVYINPVTLNRWVNRHRQPNGDK